MDDQTIAVNDMSGNIPDIDTAENTADVSADIEQTSDTDSVQSPEVGLNTTEEATEESRDSRDPAIPYSRFSEVVAEKNQYKAKAELFDKIQSDPEFASKLLNRTNPNAPMSQEEQAKQALKQLGVPDGESVKSMIQEAIQQDRIYREIDQKVNQLQKEWDGKGGKPRFDVEEIVEYGNKTGVYDPESAFKLLHDKELAEYYAKQAKSGIKSERQGKPVQNVGRDENALINEARKTGDWTKVLQSRL